MISRKYFKSNFIHNWIFIDRYNNYFITGVSAGALNACGLGAFAPDESQQASEFIFGLWNSLKGSDVFEMWKGGLIYGLLWEEGIFNNQPLVDFVNSQVGGKVLKRKVSFGTADANSAGYEIYDYNATHTLPSDYVMSAVASASIPFAFPHVDRDGHTLIDGGSIWNLDIATHSLKMSIKY